MGSLDNCGPVILCSWPSIQIFTNDIFSDGSSRWGLAQPGHDNRFAWPDTLGAVKCTRHEPQAVVGHRSRRHDRNGWLSYRVVHVSQLCRLCWY